MKAIELKGVKKAAQRASLLGEVRPLRRPRRPAERQEVWRQNAIIRQKSRDGRSELQREEGTAVDQDHGGTPAGIYREHLAAINRNTPSGQLIVFSDVHEPLLEQSTPRGPRSSTAASKTRRRDRNQGC